ncbi:MAG: hypothetical protein HY594_02015 [Candidatus Omnitrophica bacterium]|nr:hypothetical protein [Candidatus Omnitrophota bacterium]
MARVLLMYITEHSGHHRASLALEKALRLSDPNTEVLNIDAFGYFNPILSRIVDSTYMSVIKTKPEVWDYLYDNPEVAQRAQKYQTLLHRHNSPKLTRLLKRFQPTVIACTQAFPCSAVADYKETRDLDVPLYGVLTDFIPHSYWIHPKVSGYMVASDAARKRLIKFEVPPERIHHTGIPIDPVFDKAQSPSRIRQELGLSPDLPVVLVMGGGQGLGPIEEMVRGLDALPDSFHMVVVAGTNEKLKSRLDKRILGYKRRVSILGYVANVYELMSIASLIITKPGGLTTAEALSKGLPMVIVAPIPGQEAKNTEFLLQHHAAVQAAHWDDVPPLVAGLIRNAGSLADLKKSAEKLGRPRAALDIAQKLLQAV